MVKRSVVVCLVLFALAVRSGAADEERRLDTRLKLVQRAQRGAVDLSAGRALEVVSRLGSRRGFAREDAPLLLLVKYPGDRSRLEAAGFRIQSQMGSIYTGTLRAEHLSELLKLSELHFAQLSQELHAPPTPKRERSRAARGVLGGAAITPPPLATLRRPTPTSLALGQGVLVAFVDTGVDVCHQDFRNSDAQQTTRIKYLLDFSDPGDPDGDGALDGTGPFGGTLYTEADIDSSLRPRASAPGPPPPSWTRRTRPATAPTASRSPPATIPPLPGLAPAADLIVVKATREDGTLGFQSADIINALSFIDQKAGELRPTLRGEPVPGNDLRFPRRTLAGGAGDRRPGGPGHSRQGGGGRGGELLGEPKQSPSPLPGDGVRRDREDPHPDRPRLHGEPGHRERPDPAGRLVRGAGQAHAHGDGAGRDDQVSAVYGDYADVATACGDVFIANMGGANPRRTGIRRRWS